jgi:hypothetical protein
MKLLKRLNYGIVTSALVFIGVYAMPVGATGSWVTPNGTEAFQANNGYLYTNVTGGSALNTLQGMAAGTSPAIAPVTSGGYEVAFQANNGYLYLWNTNTEKAVNTLQGMAAGTSPAIAGLTGGGYAVAFQANNGYLYTYTSANGPAATTLAMTPSSNPSIAGLYNGSYAIAFSASGSNDLSFDSSAIVWSWGYPQTIELPAGLTTTNQGIEPGTNPSIAPAGTGFEAAFNANGINQINLYYSGTGAGGTNVALEPNTSPSIAESGGGGYVVAYAVPGSDDLGILGGGESSFVTDQGLAQGTSPSITGFNLSVTGLNQEGGLYQVAFQAAGTNHLVLYYPSRLYYPSMSTGRDTGQGMASNTNPSIN